MMDYYITVTTVLREHWLLRETAVHGKQGPAWVLNSDRIDVNPSSSACWLCDRRQVA